MFLIIILIKKYRKKFWLSNLDYYNKKYYVQILLFVCLNMLYRISYLLFLLLFLIPSFSYSLDDSLTKAADGGNLYEEAYKVSRQTTNENYQKSLDVLGAQLGVDGATIQEILEWQIKHCNTIFMEEHPECWDPEANDPNDFRDTCENSASWFYNECIRSVSSYVSNQTSISNSVSYMEHRIIGEDQYQNWSLEDSSFDLYNDIESIEKILYKTPGDLPTDYKLNESPKSKKNSYTNIQYKNIWNSSTATSIAWWWGGGGGGWSSGGSSWGWWVWTTDWGWPDLWQDCFNTWLNLIFLDDSIEEKITWVASAWTTSWGGGWGWWGGSSGWSTLSNFIWWDWSTLASSSPWYNALWFDSFVGWKTDSWDAWSLSLGSFASDSGSSSDGVSSSWWGEKSCWGDDDQLLSICLSLVPADWPTRKWWWDVRVKSIEEIVDAINGALTHTKQHFSVRHEYSDEFMEIRLKKVKLKDILSFNIILAEKQIFTQNSEENYKSIKKANENAFDRSYANYGITYDDNINNALERNKYNFNSTSVSLNNIPSNWQADAVELLNKSSNISNDGGNSTAMSSNTAKSWEATQKVIEERDRWARQMKKATESITDILTSFKADAKKMKSVSEQ